MKYWLLAAALALTGPVSHAATPQPSPAETAQKTTPYRPAEVMALAEQVADYQLAQLAGGAIPAKASPDTPHKTGWVQGALFVGLTELANRSSDPVYKQTILARGEGNQWQPGPNFYHADDHVIGQSYLWAYRHGGAGPEAIAPLRKRFDAILEFPPEVGLAHREYTDPRRVDCDQRWCWVDALFMAPPAWFELSVITGDAKYADYARKEFLAVTDYLYDPQEHLYYRDSRFFDRRGPNGEKVFWSRGDGWAFAGLARMIPLLPEGDPARVRMETIFREMAARLKQIQKPDGYWSPSLLSDPAHSLPETSGTAFFTYGFAWGIEAGLLPAKDYEPVVRKGWVALVRAVHPNGKLGWVQPVSDRPENVSYDDTQFYGVGAFLLAATAIADLDLKPGKDPTVQRAPVSTQAVLNVQDGGTLRDNRLSGGVFSLRRDYEVPESHFIHDGLIAFEGVGWESDLTAYRLYLDERMAIDIFGKKTPEAVLHTIGQGADDYHEPARWGMDIFKVGDTLGIGGIGVLRQDRATQLGKSRIRVKLSETAPQSASAEVTNTGFDGASSLLVTRLSIREGSPLTRVQARADNVSAPLVTGFIKHPGVTVLKSEVDASGWAYVASWGMQSLADDALGIAVFYRPAQTAGGVRDDGATVFVTFRDPADIDYAFGIAWTQDRQGVKTPDDFRKWLEAQRKAL